MVPRIYTCDKISQSYTHTREKECKTWRNPSLLCWVNMNLPVRVWVMNNPYIKAKLWERYMGFLRIIFATYESIIFTK